MQNSLLRDLELLVDSFGIERVVWELCRVCRLKAIHLEENWQDEAAARWWDEVANSLSAATPPWQ